MLGFFIARQYYSVPWPAHATKTDIGQHLFLTFAYLGSYTEKALFPPLENQNETTQICARYRVGRLGLITGVWSEDLSVRAGCGFLRSHQYGCHACRYRRRLRTVHR